MEIAETITEFLVSGKQAGWTSMTLEGYRWRLDHLQRWLAERNVTTPSGLSRSLLRHYGAEIAAKWKAATVKGVVATIRSYLRWLHQEALISEELWKALQLPKVPKRVQRTITGEELLALLEATKKPVEFGLTDHQARISALRNAAIVSLLFDSMVRASELVALKVEDIDLAGHSVFVETGKGGDSRYTTFGEGTATALKAWLAVREAEPNVLWLFVSITGNTPGCQLTPRGLRSILKALGERAGIPDVAPHAFRRGGAVEASLAGTPTRTLQALAGWKTIGMADTYTRAVAVNPRSAQDFERYSPVEAARRRNGKQ